MGNFKVRVNSEAESREVQDLAIAAGYKMDDLFCQKWDDDFCYLLLCEDMSAGFGNEIMADGDKPLSIGELRAMVNDQYAEIEQVRQSAYDKQEGGSHYKKLAIQPMQYALANKLDYAQANVVKYVTRHADKNGKEDLLKAIHNIELMIEHYYSDS